MPHLKLECSNNVAKELDVCSLFSRLHSLLAELGPFQIADMKSRLMRYDDFFVSDGAPNKSFVHLELAILSGRDPQLKKNVSTKLLQFLKNEFQQSLESLSCSFTVEIRDLDRDFYAKE
jgi:5-carboxymethyl-2-hydroxymuconate isomerase